MDLGCSGGKLQSQLEANSHLLGLQSGANIILVPITIIVPQTKIVPGTKWFPSPEVNSPCTEFHRPSNYETDGGTSRKKSVLAKERLTGWNYWRDRKPTVLYSALAR